jgi:2-polyprenyl-3-methyl-5-hydroxy-6-metoxy-1,4-benzoquinol methylase
VRDFSYQEKESHNTLDNLGFWLSSRKSIKYIGKTSGLICADLGCGYYAKLSKKIFSEYKKLDLFDIKIDPNIKSANTYLQLGSLPDSLININNNTYDRIICNNVLEHITNRKIFLLEVYRILKIGGIVVINVPSWWGKRFLEFTAFRMGISSELEMNDHKIYFDPKDLWPVLIESGFMPKNVKIFKHKFGLNTIAICKK